MDSRYCISSKVRLTHSLMAIEKAVNVNLLPQPRRVARSKPAVQVRRISVGRLSASMTPFIIQTERWSDNNYAPEDLLYLCKHTAKSFEILALMHGFDADDVQVSLSRGQVIILLAHEYETFSNWRQEYYCEVPIPADVHANEATIEISAATLKVRLNNKSGIFYRMRELIRRIKRDFALFVGKS